MSETFADRWARFWDSPEAEPARLPLTRLLFFAALALDTGQQLVHAGRYGAGRFNVSHLPSLDGILPAPTAPGILLLTLTSSLLCLRLALGARATLALPALAVSLGAAVLWSQLDSYQHHYLMVLVCVALSGAACLTPEARRAGEIAPWGYKLVRVQIAVVYAWAAVAKLDGRWLSGQTLDAQLQVEWARTFINTLAERLAVAPVSVVAAGAVAVMVVEALFALAWLTPRLWPLLWPLGLLFHGSVEALDLKIGQFSLLMITLYTLVMPATLARALGRLTPNVEPAEGAWAWRLGAGLVVGALGLALPFAQDWGLVGLWALLTLAVTGPSPSAAARAVLSAALVVGLSRSGDLARDYYRFIGGDARVRGELPAAAAAYAEVVRLDPDYFSGRVRLCQLLTAVDRAQEAMPHCEAALRMNPGQPDAVAAEAAARAALR
ncbi:HTTM domain-containing protein [Myxococcota bacterium]|nr:HTTM domain-containing protein [Myxococcota bacterium]